MMKFILSMEKQLKIIFGFFVFIAAFIGAGLGFLWFNFYPAQIFMGDTGSLALGGAFGIIAILIKLESRGPVFFKQSRNGFNYKEFDCYKFRSMTPNKNAHLHQATRGDQRVTKVGRFMRKTSIDELPQFFNVLFGDMSVVGPRPHMVSHTNMYAKKIDKFMVRHFVKPGITGLAQISGFRGEVETDKDIIGRVKYDIFYIENWSLLLDIKIIFQTFLNAVKGEEKAY